MYSDTEEGAKQCIKDNALPWIYEALIKEPFSWVPGVDSGTWIVRVDKPRNFHKPIAICAVYTRDGDFEMNDEMFELYRPS